MKKMIEKLASAYPQLYLDPDKDGKDLYKLVVLQGEEPEKKSLAHYRGDAGDRDETVDTPAGKVRVVTFGDRRDFELVLRGLMAAKEGPEAQIPQTQGAAMLRLFNWPKIKAHLAAFPEEEQNEEFRRFTAVRENYIDELIVLSRGPYSHVEASAVGCDEETWLSLSDTIRRYHELTHAVCRRLYPDDIDEVRDELIADAVGLYAAYGRFDQEKELLFLGVKDGRYVGGRLENYTDDPAGYVGEICGALARMKEKIEAMPGAEPFDLIAPLMGRA